ncbi:MAG: GldG family protein, partial [Cellvibrionaceae bacterium]
MAFNALPAWRLDLTEDELYTLGSGSKQLVAELEQPITLSLYFSQSLADDLPQLKDYAQRIEDLLFEYQALNPNKVIVKVIDPEPFSDAEDQVSAAGLQGAPVTLGGDSLYLGLIATRDDGEQQIISFFNPERERFLEYDVSQILHRLGQVSPIDVKVLSGVQMFGGYDFASQRSTGPWAVVEQLRG